MAVSFFLGEADQQLRKHTLVAVRCRNCDITVHVLPSNGYPLVK
jgi:hypothetical protein